MTSAYLPVRLFLAGNVPTPLEMRVWRVLTCGAALPRYTRYVQRDPLGGTKRAGAVRAGEEEQSTAGGPLEAAPVSMSRTNQQSTPQEGFLYSPGMGQVPQMDVPSALPHLPGGVCSTL